MANTPGKFRGPSIRPVGGAGRARSQSPNPQGDSKKQGALLRDLDERKLEGDPLTLLGNATVETADGDTPVIGPPEDTIGDRLIFVERTVPGPYKVAIGVDSDRTLWFQSTGFGASSDEEGGFDWYCPGASTTSLARRMRLASNGDLILGLGDPADAPGGGTAQLTCEGALWVDGPIATDFLQVDGGPSSASVVASFSIGNATTGDITFDLPGVGGAEAYEFTFKRVNGGAFNVIVDASGGDLIDGAATKTLGSQYACLVIKSDGTDWHVVSTFGTVT
jgi:hypothetical protein